jgi:hypothetical protein
MKASIHSKVHLPPSRATAMAAAAKLIGAHQVQAALIAAAPCESKATEVSHPYPLAEARLRRFSICAPGAVS